MAPTRTLSRRSFLGRVAGGAIGGAALTISGPPARALQVTDNDRGPNADPANGGRGNRGHTDADSGPYADPAGQGRGMSDNDRGANADSAGRGRHFRRAGPTDGDAGSNADPSGIGRGRRRGRCRGITDSDSGNGIWTDPARCGRGPHNRSRAASHPRQSG